MNSETPHSDVQSSVFGVERSPQRGAVFLSYASQDAEAALRLCSGLRAAGVVVWFDQNEPLDTLGAHGLVGGDAWDAKIRRQIKECALFVPVISAATQARLEGYFRIEWKLAAQRTHAMAEAKTFLLPVVIDETRDGDAHVPEEFRAVQWTRLALGESNGRAPGGAAAAFAARVQRILSHDLQPVATGSAPPLNAPRTTGGKPVARRRRWLLPLAVAVVLTTLIGAWLWRERPSAASGEKTLAVLPFATARSDPDNESLSDGVADELLTQLGRTPGLRVSGRASSFSFKGQSVTDAEIARRLGVNYLVAGSFERSGAQVRIRVQLVSAANGAVLWSETFTRELTNVFALQDEMAGSIAQTLRLTLGSTARAQRTVDPAAYGLVQKGRYLWLQRSDAALAQAIAACEEAIRLDGNYAEAYAGLADAALVRGWYMGLEGVNLGAQYFAQARRAAQQALALDPAMAEPHAALGAINMNEERFDEAEREFQAALRLNPNYSYAHHWRAHLLAMYGRIDEALAEMDRATQIDPFSLSTLVIRALMLGYVDRNAECVAVADQAIALRRAPFLPADGVRTLGLFQSGRKEEALAAAQSFVGDVTQQPRWWLDSAAIYVLRKSGREAEARAHAGRLLAAWPANGYFQVYADAALGRVDAAMDGLLAQPVTPTARTMIYYSDIWAEVRQSPRFPNVLQQLRWAEDYARAQASKARYQRERGVRK